MQHPSLSFDLRVIEDNARILGRLCGDKGVIPVGISKLIAGTETIARAMILGGIQTIGDTQLQNLMKIADLPLRKMLLRRVLLSDVEDVVEYADISLHTNGVVLEALSRAAVAANKIHEVILIHNLDSLLDSPANGFGTEILVEQVLRLPGLTFGGICSQLACYEDYEKGSAGTGYATDYSAYSICSADCASSHSVESLSGADIAGVVLRMPEKNSLPSLTQLRMGSALIMGLGLNTTLIPDMPQSAISLEAEIVEIKEKSSVYMYSIHAEQPNHELQFNDRGLRLRALCAIGKRDVDVRQLTPADDGIMIIGATDKVLILDITDANTSYQIGEPLHFHLSYHGVLQCMASEAVSKHYWC